MLTKYYKNNRRWRNIDIQFISTRKVQYLWILLTFSSEIPEIANCMYLPQDPERRREAAVHWGSRETTERAQEAASALQSKRPPN